MVESGDAYGGRHTKSSTPHLHRESDFSGPGSQFFGWTKSAGSGGPSFTSLYVIVVTLPAGISISTFTGKPLRSSASQNRTCISLPDSAVRTTDSTWQ